MQLPNPFKLVDTFTRSSAGCRDGQVTVNSAINPGPGLPQARAPTYNYTLPSPKPFQAGRSWSGAGYAGGAGGGGGFLSYSCDRCDRSFKSKEILDAHVAEHVPCGIDGCVFVAHPKIVAKHVEMQHRTGLASKIMRLTTPQEIEKWKEERRRNFPTSANVERRQAELKEKRERGELLQEENKRFDKKRKHNQRRHGQADPLNPHEMGRKRFDRRTGKQPSMTGAAEKAEIQPVPPKKVMELHTPSKIVRELSDGEINSDEEGEAAMPACVTSSTNNALTSLMGCYASDSEGEPESKAESERAQTAIVAKLCENPTEPESTQKTGAKTKECRQPRRKRTRANKKGKKSAINPQNAVPAKRQTLLQKLLEDEIRHERNVILQCVHYIVQQNFFGIGSG